MHTSENFHKEMGADIVANSQYCLPFYEKKNKIIMRISGSVSVIYADPAPTERAQV